MDEAIDAETQAARQAAREARAKLEREVAPPSSLYAECVQYAEQDGGHMLMKALLFSEPWSRPPTDEIAAHDANQAWDHAMHLKTQAEYAIAHAYKLTGDRERQAFHARKAEIGYPRLFWPSEAFLGHVATQLERARN
jgi:hypothetical protein